MLTKQSPRGEPHLGHKRAAWQRTGLRLVLIVAVALGAAGATAAAAPAASTPSSPASVTLTANDGRLTVEWDSPMSDGGNSLTGYRVEWKAAGQDWASASSAAVSAASRAYTILGLANGAAHDVRVAARFDGGVGDWSAQASASAAVVPGAPRNLVIEGTHERLELSWNAPHSSSGPPVTGYIVQWRSGTESYDTVRQNHVNEHSELSTRLYDLNNGKVYVVRVATVSDTTTIASAVTAAAPESARDRIERQIIQTYEGESPWLRQAWSNRPLPIRIVKSLGFYVSTGIRVNGFKGVPNGIRIGLGRKGYKRKNVVVHELAHHFTLDPRASDADGPVGIGWMYFSQRFKGHCPVAEIYADVLTYYTVRSKPHNYAYLVSCRQIATRGLADDEAVAVVDSVARGEVPDWFEDRYGRGGGTRDDGTFDLDAVWADLRTNANKRGAAYQMRHLFGGYCSLREADWAIRDSGPAHGNPWSDGGCDWRRPQSLTLTPRADTLTVAWNPPRYEASPAVTQYVVQWRAADQDYDPSRQVLVPSTAALEHTIEGLTEGIEHSVRVAAVSGGAPDTFADNDGHSRVSEASDTPRRPGPPGAVDVVSGDGELLVVWGELDNRGLDVTGYVVEWKSGSESYDATRRLEVSGASSSSARVSGLSNGVAYTLRVSAVATPDNPGVPSMETTATAMPVGVAAVGGVRSLRMARHAPGGGNPA